MKLDASHLTVRFGPVNALTDVSLAVDGGQVLGLVGPNGAGKTTLLDALSGLVPLAAGTASLDGTDLTRVPAHRRARLGLARTFQALDLFEDLTVAENLAVPADTAGRPPPSTTPGTDRLPAALTFGERKDLALDRALAGRPQVLLLDEPAAGLDPAARTALAGRIRHLANEGLAVVLADHDLDLVLGLCDQVCVLDFGRVIATGPPAEVRTDPKVAAAYLGTEPLTAATTAAAPGELLVDHPTVEVRAGEVVALLGPNGAGKTTTLRTLAGLAARPDGARATVLGQPLPASPHRLARVGLAFVPQDRAVLPSLTVAENLRVATGDRAAIAQALERFPALVPLLGRRAGRLSGGEQQLLALARAFARRPRLLLLDEPSTGLAPRAAGSALDAAQALARDHSAGVLLAEQHPQLALEVADRAVVLTTGGRVVHTGPAADLATHPEILERAYLGED